MQFDPIPRRRTTAPRPPTRPERSRRGWWRHLWRWAWIYVALLGALSGVVAAASIHMPQVESLEGFTPSLVTYLHDRHGEVAKSYAVENRILLGEGDVPELLERAILAVEDDRFYQHGGIDLNGVLRAAVENVKAGRITQGGSTLTMQVAENLFHTRGRSWKRKMSEALLAVEIEKRYSKPQILTLYANIVYMGAGQYGMEAAARHYFNKSVGELTLPEAAVLAGIPQRPNDFNAYRNPDLVIKRRNHVLGRMLDEGFVSAEEHAAATAAPLVLAKRRPRATVETGAYFAEEVRRYLEERYGSERLYDGGLHVYTTLDPNVQRATEESLRQQLLALDHRKGWRGPLEQLPPEGLADRELPSWGGDEEALEGSWYEGIVLASDREGADVKILDTTWRLERRGIEWTRKAAVSEVLSPGDVAWFRVEAPEEDDDGEPFLVLEQEPRIEAAAVVLESSTGAVRGLVGGWDFERSKFNRVTQAQRQVGSAFKPFVYGAALENGWTAADTVFDAPVSFPGSSPTNQYRPRNYHRSYWGILTLRRALEKSINVSAVKLHDLVGVDRVVDFARRCGITSEMPPYPSLALGSADLVPLEVAAAYAAIANHGLYVAPYLVERVEGPDGRILEEHFAQAQKAMEPEVAFVLTHMLEGVVDRGTGYRLHTLPLDLAGKTGTTNEYSDAWFVGYTPRYTLLVWVGYDVKKTLGRGMTGAHAALPIWQGIAEAGLEDGWLAEGGEFPVPAGVSFQTVEYYSGRLVPEASGSGLRTIREAFVAGTEPRKVWEPRWSAIMTLPWFQQVPFYIPKEGERMPGIARDVDDLAGDEGFGEPSPDEATFAPGDPG